MKRKQFERLNALASRLHEHASHILTIAHDEVGAELMNDTWRLIAVLNKSDGRDRSGRCSKGEGRPDVV